MALLFENNRDISVDIAKGIGIILVVWAHTQMSDILYSFHMPLFFIISGFYLKDEETKQFLYKRFRTLVVPLFLFYIFSLITKVGLRYFTRSKQELFEKLNDGSMFKLTTVDVTLWFIVCLLIMLVLYHLIERHIINIYIKIFLVVLLSSIGLYFGLQGIYVPCYVLQALICLPFIYLGNLYNNKVKKHLNGIVLLAISFVFFVISYSYWMPKTNLLQMQISGVFGFYVPAISGSFMIIGASQLLAKIPFSFAIRVLSSIGVMSLIIMCLSEDVRFAFEFCKTFTPFSLLNTALETSLIVGLTYLSGWLIDKRMRWVYKI